MEATIPATASGVLMRPGYMKRTHPVGRLLEPLVQLAGGFLLYVQPGEFGGEDEHWLCLVPTGPSPPPGHPPIETATMIRVKIPITSTFTEAREMLAVEMERARGR